MTPLRRIVLLLACAAPLAAQSVRSRAVAPQPEPNLAPMAGSFSVSGRVVDASTGAGIGRVLVHINGLMRPPASGSTYSDPGGNFRFDHLDAGDYSMGFQKSGYNGARSAQPVVHVDADHAEGQVTLKLTRNTALMGRVIDENGEPMQGVQVQAWRAAARDGRRTFAPMGQANTDDRGEYRIFTLPPGRYYMSAGSENPRGAPRERRGVRRIGEEPAPVNYGQIFYPGAHDPSAAALIEAVSGQEQRIDFTLNPEHTVHVTGRVILPKSNGSFNPGFSLMLLNRGGLTQMRGGIGISRTLDGAFDAPAVPPGAYWLRAEMFGPNQRASGRIAVDVGDADVDNVTLTVQPGFEIPVIAHTDDGAAAPDFSVVFVNPDQMDQSGYERSHDGNHVIENMFPGSYRVRVHPNPKYYVKSATVAGQDALRGTVTIAGQPGPLELTLSSKVASVNLDVSRDDKPVNTGMVVVLSKLGQEYIEAARLVVNGDGHGTLSGLGPGEYTLLATDDPDSIEYNEPSSWKRLQDYAQTVKLDEGASVQVKLRMLP